MNDVKFAFRQLLKNPGFTAVAVLTLALGIGANTAIFSLLNTVMFQALPYPEPDRLVRVFRTSPQSDNWPHSVANFLDHREQNAVFEGMAAFTATRFSLAEPGEPAESMRGIAATSDLFSVLGMQAAIGRVFTAEEDQPGRNQVVVLNHGFWLRRFAGDTNVIGRTLRVDGESVEVIGVLPAACDFPQLWGPVDAWRPLAFTPGQRRERGENWLNSLARLKRGVSLAQAEAGMKDLAARLAKLYPEHNSPDSLRVVLLRDCIGDNASRRFAWLLLGLTGFVLLIACVNLANLQLARVSIRSRELAVRLALGVGRLRLMRQLVVESLVLSLLGGAAGIALAIWLSGFIGSHITHPYFPHGLEISVDARVLYFALSASIMTGVIFGAGPAWFASQTNMNEVLKASNRGNTSARSQQRLRHALIIGEVAFALILLSGAGLFIRGLHQFIHQEPGWRVDGLLTGWLAFTSEKYHSPDQRGMFVERLEQRLSVLPGVQHAAISSSLPIFSFGRSRGFRVEGAPPAQIGQEPLVHVECVTPGYFDTFGIRVREGRAFTAADGTNRPSVVIINEAMARQFWAGQSPLGKRIGGTDPADPDWMEIVGVVNDIRFPGNLGKPDTRWQSYRPIAQEPRSYVALELRTSGPPESVAAGLRQAVAELDPDLPVNEIESARARVNRLLSHFTIASMFLGVFAFLSLVLAALGIYGVVSYLVVQRTAEIGIRVALGAQMFDVVWLVLSKGLVLSCFGIVVGFAGALGMASLLAAAVPELPARDSSTLVVFIAALMIIILFACWLPARRAAKVDPIEALRCE